METPEKYRCGHKATLEAADSSTLAGAKRFG